MSEQVPVYIDNVQQPIPPGPAPSYGVVSPSLLDSNGALILDPHQVVGQPIVPVQPGAICQYPTYIQAAPQPQYNVVMMQPPRIETTVICVDVDDRPKRQQQRQQQQEQKIVVVENKKKEDDCTCWCVACTIVIAVATCAALCCKICCEIITKQ